MSTSAVALVTGSTGGIGLATARRLAADGMTVIVHSRSEPEKGDAVAAEFGGAYLQADLADEDDCRRLAERAGELFGRLDVLVNNAGISRPIPHDDLAAATPEVWREMLQVNMIAPWLVITGLLPRLQESDRDGGGCIVNVTSHAALRPKGSSIPYAALKAALAHTTRLLAAALGPDVRVNGVAPGLVETRMTQGWDAHFAQWENHSPMRRAAQPEDVADMISALIANPYVTGEIVLLDGGLNLR